MRDGPCFRSVTWFFFLGYRQPGPDNPHLAVVFRGAKVVPAELLETWKNSAKEQVRNEVQACFNINSSKEPDNGASVKLLIIGANYFYGRHEGREISQLAAKKETTRPRI